MKFKIYIFFLLSIFYFLLSGISYAVYDPLSVSNNKFGIHILFPSELEKAARLVNSSGGDWGYVTIPIQSVDRNLEKWQAFMDEAKRWHIIPIIRLATYPVDDHWPRPNLYEAIDFANFLNSLSWPTKNRYVILFNEPNHNREWGGEVAPDEYARFLSDSIDIFKQRSQDFFLLNAGFDAAAPSSQNSMNSLSYMSLMEKAVPGVFRKLDGWASHSYPNPSFSSSPSYSGRNSIAGYKWETDFLKRNFAVTLPVFITETGWDITLLGEGKTSEFTTYAFNNIWNDNDIVAVTPFLLEAYSGDFKKFSWFSQNYEPSLLYQKIVSLPKNSGKPQVLARDNQVSISAHESQSDWSAQKTGLWTKSSKNFLKKIVSWFWPREAKTKIRINNAELTIELADTPEKITKGLSGKEKLDDNTGMLFVMEKKDIYSFWMKDMRFPLDIIWVEDDKIVDITKNVPVEDNSSLTLYQSSQPVNFVLEVNTGFSDKYGVKVGDRIRRIE